MQYYISWTHSDPVYQQYLHGIGVLVSPPNVSFAWKVRDWPMVARMLMLDSGAYQYYREKRNVTPREVLVRQLSMLDGWVAHQGTPAGICHLDLPMMGTRNWAELERRVIVNLANAKWLMEHLEEHSLSADIEPIGVIQGYSTETVYYVAQALADMGYKRFALGSLAGMVANSADELLRRVEAALEAVGSNVHVLGVSSVRLMPQISSLGVRSADSGAPIREAWMGGVYYSQPFRRYKLASAHFKEWSRTYGFAELLSEPQPCDCPVCMEDSTAIMEQRGKKFVNLRAIHNCYHLVRELQAS